MMDKIFISDALYKELFGRDRDLFHLDDDIPDDTLYLIHVAEGPFGMKVIDPKKCAVITNLKVDDPVK